MRKLLITIICLLNINGFALQAVLAESNSAISIGDADSVLDADSVTDAVERITAILEDQGFKVVLVVNHTEAAKSVELELAPTQVILARPSRFLERILLKRSDTIGIDLPVKILVFEGGEEGEIQVNSNSIGYLVDRHDIKLNDILLRLLQSKVEQFGEAANGLVTVESRQTMEDTVADLQEAIMSNPAFRIPLVLDYADDRGRHRFHRGRRLPVLIVFGNPLAGTPLMQADQRIGIDLPQKFLVWEDSDGSVNITYNDPFFIVARHNIQGQDARLGLIAGALRNFALLGAGIDPNEIN